MLKYCRIAGYKMQKTLLILLWTLTFWNLEASGEEEYPIEDESQSAMAIVPDASSDASSDANSDASSDASSIVIASAIGDCNSTFKPASGSYNFIKDLKAVEIPEGINIGDIYYTRLPVFDESNPDEDNFLYRWANRFHPITKEYVLEDLILFEEEQIYDARQIDESARILRARKYLYDANIRPVRSCDNRVDIEVITRDVWSFNPDVSFSRSGGVSKHRFSIRDVNLLGTGKQLTLVTKKDAERKSKELHYKDNNISGSRIRTRIIIADNDDGSDQYLGLALPFYALNSKRAWNLKYEHIDRIDTQYFLGEKVTEIGHEIDENHLSYGFSKGLAEGSVHRWLIGYGYRRDRFSLGDLLPPPTDYPMEKTLHYPFFSYQYLQDNFAKSFNLDQIHRTEDLHLGKNFGFLGGYADEAFGSDQDRFVYKGKFSDTLSFKKGVLWQHALKWEGKWNFETRKTEDLLIEYGMRYFRGQTKHRSFVASFSGIYSKNLNTNEQVVLGGETGLRGYDRKFLTGDRMVLLSLEERMYSDFHLFNLVRFGWAIFVDAGKAWNPQTNNGTDNDLLVNAGFGLRLASSKADAGKILHIDLAYPLKHKDHPGVDGRQLLIVMKQSF